MQNIVTIKGREDGLEITLNDKETYPVIREELLQKLKKNTVFFKDSKTRVVIRGKELSEAQRREIKRVFAMDYGITDVLYGDEADMLKSVEAEMEKSTKASRRKREEAEEQPDEAVAVTIKTKKASRKREAQDADIGDAELVSSAYFDAQSIFLNGTVRSGQRIECEGDIVIIGDVNPGAEIIAGGSVAVFGKMRGLAHAGCAGRKDVCVAALYMMPSQLRLSGRVVSFPNDREEPKGPEVAEMRDGTVVIRAVGAR